MSQLNVLKFDKMEVNTSLAEEYFRDNKYTFYSISKGNRIVKDTHYFTADPWNNKISISTANDPMSKYCEKDLSAVANSLWQLAKKIEANGDLFCQLQHLLVKTSMDECKKHLQILINKCQYWSSLFGKYTVGNNINQGEKSSPVFYDETDQSVVSLLSFPYVIDLLSHNRCVMIRATDSAAISTLFIKLCAEVGLGWRVSLRVHSIMLVEGTQYEVCCGIVSDTADVDSAIHAFMESPTNVSWQLSKILVQESVYEDFQKALQWKCSLNRGDSTTDKYDQLKKFCTDIQVGGGKMFLLDYVGGGELTSELNAVTVEAYRTSKELHAMMSKYIGNFVSLWATDAAQANETAMSLPACLIWINSYGVFSGPPQISECLVASKQKPVDGYDDKGLESRANAWLKLNLKNRQDRMARAVQNVLEVANDQVRVAAKRLQTLLRTHRLDLMDVNKNSMWIGVEKPVGFVYVNRTEDMEFFVNAVASIVHGNHVVLNADFVIFNKLVNELEKVGVPISIASKYCNRTSNYKLYNTKMIYSNFGTIFAN